MRQDQRMSLGAARDYLAFKYGGAFVELESAPVAGVAATSMVGNNPDRLGLLVLNPGAANVTLGLTPGVTSGNGIVLAANGGAVSIDVDEDFTLATRQLYGVSAAGNVQLYVLEIARNVYFGGQERS